MRTTTQAAFLAWLIFSPALFCAQDIFIASYNGDLEAVKRLIEQDPKLVPERTTGPDRLVNVASCGATWERSLSQAPVRAVF